MAHEATTWDAIVIGAGLGGLSAAAAFARAGKKVLVLERAGNFGGCATTWRHGRLTMEASLHEIDGAEIYSDHGSLRQLGVADRVEPIATGEFYEVRGAVLPKDIVVPYGAMAAMDAVGDAFPAARKQLADYAAMLKRINASIRDLEDIGQKGPGVLVSMLISGRLFEVFAEMRQTVAEGMRHAFDDNEAVKLALCPHLMYFDDDPAKLSFLGFAAITSQYLEEGGYYLRGGSRTLTLALLHAIKDAGGEARHHREVLEILTDAQGRAVGVRCQGADGAIEEARADIVFAGVAPQVVEAMLPEPARGPFAVPYKTFEPSISLFSIAFGLDRLPGSFGVTAYSTFVYPDWMTRLDQYPASADVFGGEPGAALPLYALCDYASLDPALGQAGDLHALSLTGVDRLWAWDGLDEAQDKARRDAWIAAFIADLDRRYPGIAGAIVQAEMSTARTLKNRLGTPNGEVYGFRPTPQRLFGKPPTPRTAVPGLFLSSAYTVSGGYAGAMHGGLMAAQAAMGDLRRRSRQAEARDTLYA